jgi:hypothetical protein
MESTGTPDVPVAVEISFADGGRLEGCTPGGEPGTWLLAKGEGVYRVGSDAIRFGPGAAPHTWTQLRGAEARLPGTSVYVTGITPFDHTIEFRWA